MLAQMLSQRRGLSDVDFACSPPWLRGISPVSSHGPKKTTSDGLESPERLQVSVSE